MGSFLSGIFTGASPTLTGDENQAGDVAGFGISQGEGDITNASGFYNDLLSGNQATIAKLLAPQISDITGQAQQQKNKLAQFGDRSGGLNSKAQTIDDSTRSNINDMISKLTAAGVSGDASLGTSTLGLGLNANQVQEQDSQQALKNKQDSLLGGLITGGADAGLDAITGGLADGLAPGTPGGPVPWAPYALTQAGNATPLQSDDILGNLGF
jgi:hypothetical protein